MRRGGIANTPDGRLAVSLERVYDDDIALWSEPQAALLRPHAATTRANDAIDWANIIEEIESVASEQRHAV